MKCLVSLRGVWRTAATDEAAACVHVLQAAARMAVFPVTPGVFTMVTFSRCLYAQLTQQQFHPPKVFQKVSVRACEALTHMASPHRATVVQAMLPVDDPDYSAADLGMKLACGFEMLMNRGPGGALHVARRRGDSSTSAGGDASAGGGGSGAMSDEQFLRVKATPEWTQYKAALAARGFFHDLHDGSVQFVARERKAAQSLLASRVRRRWVCALTTRKPGNDVLACVCVGVVVHTARVVGRRQCAPVCACCRCAR